MSLDLVFGLTLGVFWGLMVAGFIHLHWLGRFLAARLMWFVVSVGVGVNLLIALLLWTSEAGMVSWWRLVALFAVSAVPLAVASLSKLARYFQEMIRGIQD